MNNPIPVSSSRMLDNDRPFDLKRFFFQWEWLLALIFIIINIQNAVNSPHYMDFNNLTSAIQMFCDKAILVFPMMMVILLGEIDISIASVMALSATVMGVAYQLGAPMGISIGAALLTGFLCGFLNGLILSKFNELSSMIVTLATQILFRGIANIILEDGAVSGFPDWFQYLGWGYLGKIPFVLIFFIIEALIFAYVIHLTPFGRGLYAIGNNALAAKYSGIQIDQVKVIVFTVLGVFGAVAGIFLASKMGSVRPSIAKTYELDVIAMVVLGGVSNNGGKGRLIGVVLATFIVGLLRHGLGLINIPSQTIMIIVGVLLIAAVALPNTLTSLKSFISRHS